MADVASELAVALGDSSHGPPNVYSGSVYLGRVL